jgi:hypothetical protein
MVPAPVGLNEPCDGFTVRVRCLSNNTNGRTPLRPLTHQHGATPQRGGLTLAQRRTTRWGLYFAIAFTALSGCSPQQVVIEEARMRGARAGREEGRFAGSTAALNAARADAFDQRVEQLYAVDEFRRNPFYTGSVMGGFFILGFGVQWIAFYIPRRVGILRDVDWILLPREMTETDLINLPAPSEISPERPSPPFSGPAMMLLLALLATMGCKNAEQAAWQRGYDANRRFAYDEGWHQAEAAGKQYGPSQKICNICY